MERVQDQYRFWRHRFRPRGRHPLQKSLKRGKHKLWQRHFKQKATRRPHPLLLLLRLPKNRAHCNSQWMENQLRQTWMFISCLRKEGKWIVMTTGHQV